MHVSRRGLLTGFAALLAAPAIVRAGSLMPVKVWTPELPRHVLVGTQAQTWGAGPWFDIEGTDEFGRFMRETISGEEIERFGGFRARLTQYTNFSISARQALIRRPDGTTYRA